MYVEHLLDKVTRQPKSRHASFIKEQFVITRLATVYKRKSYYNYITNYMIFTHVAYAM